MAWVLVLRHDGISTSIQAWQCKGLHPSHLVHYLIFGLAFLLPLNPSVQALAPRHEGTRVCTQAIWWNLHYLIFGLEFWFSVPITFEYNCMSIRDGVSTSACDQSFYIPTACECRKFNFLLQQVGFECLHHSSCIYFRAKVSFVGPCHLPKFWGKNIKATTKVTAMSHQ